MTAPAVLADLWNQRHMYCADEVDPTSTAEARYVINTHGGHGPACRQYFAADAYWRGDADHDV